ncbi:MAG: DNA mismatch repair protein MutL [Flavobacteriales bacterium CG_4_9_14_0_2_um_filter_35_242]|nr:DNA mismatch repair endonuclease MutL [Zetaproteobacteria bacterium]NDK17459.1 DNA mismatch repair endonuclease MutL [Flavobacteriales bacterium]PIR13691.1 MAG: DNA mismatch repair protein MutL [Flavobacteriales bacterium CG11_big_fil_rev_8_21_14_0_20_35_7]PJA06123.1 MAG: DNA mismatch repair protein MutL [Flavobacteriales bacterium CG_4_10_14_0_2_um_filter_35_18]PJC60705.1 MAG: DNA mismatch repair protein MutL [Flavobacteriales bacterium CG_4_9_14_0_2_um_filter_35_242]
MTDIIHLLPDHVANQIAAGEVVQRPASVVKELLENAIDAHATHIKLLVKDAGKILIQVIDNGFGMSPTDARLAFERHATSKINCAEDLFNLHTKGFRGEALASIAAIAHVELKTKTDNQELGTQITIEGSKVMSQEVISNPTGTSIAVKNLFYNIPARRNFLKSNSIETLHIIDEFQRAALAHPDIAFSFYHNDSNVYQLAAGNFRQRIVNVFGKKTNEKLVPITEETELVSITGFIAKPEFAKKKRGEQFFFANNRFIKSNYLNHAITSAFEGLLGSGYHPTYFLYLNVPPNQIDINIHPTKTEVKFENEQSIYAIIKSTIKHSLGQYQVAPILDFEQNNSFDLPYDYRNKMVGIPKIEIDANFNPFNDNFKQNPPLKNWETLYDTTPIFDGNNANAQPNENLFDDQANSLNQVSLQIRNTYILGSIKSGLVMINQNLAHQRILYEDFLTKITLEESTSQALIFPLSINLNQQEIQLIKSLISDFESIGFRFEFKSNDDLLIIGIPLTVKESQIQPLLENLLDDLQNQTESSNFSQVDGIAKSMAKNLAIKNGTSLSAKEQESILNNLFSCKEPNISPQGKATFITLSIDDIEKKFKSF